MGFGDILGALAGGAIDSINKKSEEMGKYQEDAENASNTRLISGFNCYSGLKKIAYKNELVRRRDEGSINFRYDRERGKVYEI